MAAADRCFWLAIGHEMKWDWISFFLGGRARHPEWQHLDDYLTNGPWYVAVMSHGRPMKNPNMAGKHLQGRCCSCPVFTR